MMVTMRCLLISVIAVLLFSCGPSRDTKDTTGYDIISQQCYVIRPEKPAEGDTSAAAAQRRQQEIMAYLEKHQFPQHVAASDSLLFRRANGQEVIFELPAPQDAWEAHTVIVFNPDKNPLFVNLRKGTEQVERYLK